jgi:hypothetical protein
MNYDAKAASGADPQWFEPNPASASTDAKRAMAAALTNLRIKQRARATKDLREALEAALNEPGLLTPTDPKRHVAMALVRLMEEETSRL